MIITEFSLNQLNNINPPSILTFYSQINYFLTKKNKTVLSEQNKSDIAKSKIQINFFRFNPYAFNEVNYILFYNDIKVSNDQNKYPIVIKIKITSSPHGHKELIARIDKKTLITGGVIQSGKFIRYSDEWSSRVSFDGRYLGEMINNYLLKAIGLIN